jgi:hypothetical protein
MKVGGRQRRGERSPAQPPSLQGRLEELLTRSVAEVVDELAPGRADLRISRYTSVPYAGVKLEVVPRNPRAAAVEIEFDEVDVRVLVGSQGCGCLLSTEEALGPEAQRFLRSVVRSAVSGSYRETASRRGWWVCRVEGLAGAPARGPSLGASRLRIYGTPRTVSFEPY